MVYEYFDSDCNLDLPDYDAEIKKECNGKIITNNAYTKARENYWNLVFQEKYNEDGLSKKDRKCLKNKVKENNKNTSKELSLLKKMNEEMHNKINKNLGILFRNKKKLESGEETELIRNFRLENSGARTIRNRTISIILIVLVFVFLIIEFCLLYL